MELIKFFLKEFPTIIGNTVYAGLVVTIIWFLVIRPLKRTIKFYESVLHPDYDQLLEFLYKYNYDYAKEVLGDKSYMYSDKIEKALYECFASRLKVRLLTLPNRIGIIKYFFDQAEKYLHGRKAPDHYWSTIYKAMKWVISECHPGYFAGCYVQSLAENFKPEENVRHWIKKVYEDWLSDPQNKEQHDKALQFIELINKRIEEYQGDPEVSEEVKKVLLQNKLKVHVETATKKSITRETIN